MRFVESCCGEVDGIVVIFCIKNIDAPTSIGSITVGSGLAKSSQKNVLSIGIDCLTIGNQPYKYFDKTTKFSGSDGTVFIIA